MCHQQRQGFETINATLRAGCFSATRASKKERMVAANEVAKSACCVRDYSACCVRDYRVWYWAKIYLLATAFDYLLLQKPCWATVLLTWQLCGVVNTTDSKTVVVNRVSSSLASDDILWTLSKSKSCPPRFFKRLSATAVIQTVQQLPRRTNTFAFDEKTKQ